MTREKKLDAIYKEMANKELIFGCTAKLITKKGTQHDVILIGDISNGEKYFVVKDSLDKDVDWFYTNDWYYEFIWHPVMIGDVIDCIEKKDFDVNKKIPWFWFEDEKGIDDESKLFLIQGYYTDKIIAFWDKKRESIETQSDECIDYVYSLIQKS